MSPIILFITFILFIILTPGVLLYIPSKKSILYAAIIHSIIFTFILYMIINSKLFNIDNEYFQNQDQQECMCPMPLSERIKKKLNIDDSKYLSTGTIKVNNKEYPAFKPNSKGLCTTELQNKNCKAIKCPCKKNPSKKYTNYYNQCKYNVTGNAKIQCK
jgi:hypothetical protein